MHTYLAHYMRVGGLPSQGYQRCVQLYTRVMEYSDLVSVGHKDNTSESQDSHSRSHSAAIAAASESSSHSTGPEQHTDTAPVTNTHRLQEGIAACRAFLAAAAALARDKFTGCNVPRMVVGCVLVAAGLLLLLRGLVAVTAIAVQRAAPITVNGSTGGVVATAQGLTTLAPGLAHADTGQEGRVQALPTQVLAARNGPHPTVLSAQGSINQSHTGTARFQPTQTHATHSGLAPTVPTTEYSISQTQTLHSMVASVCHPCVLGPFSVCVFQSCSLFGLDWMMSEGRVQCVCAVVCVLTLGLPPALTTLVRVIRSSQNTSASASHTKINRLRRVAGVLVLTCLAVLCLVSLAQKGLVDRGSADPHDKSAQSTTLEDLLGVTTHTDHTNVGTGAPQARPEVARGFLFSFDAWGVVLQLLPVAMFGWVVCGALALLHWCECDLVASAAVKPSHSFPGAIGLPNMRPSELSGSMQGASKSAVRYLSLVCIQCACMVSWWVQQLTSGADKEHMTLASITHTLRYALANHPHTNPHMVAWLILVCVTFSPLLFCITSMYLTHRNHKKTLLPLLLSSVGFVVVMLWLSLDGGSVFRAVRVNQFWSFLWELGTKTARCVRASVGPLYASWAETPLQSLAASVWGAVGHVPLRLLLPRVVYGAGALVCLQLLVGRLITGLAGTIGTAKGKVRCFWSLVTHSIPAL